MKNTIKTIIFCALSFSFAYAQETLDIKKILRLQVNASINPATLDYIKSGIKKAEKDQFDALLVTMNTPGGLVSTTKEILTSMGASKVPVFVWITPEGASATSAGAIISSGAHLLAMSEGTNIGAAAPVSMGKDIDEAPKNPLDKTNKKDKNKSPIPAPPSSDMKKKAVNDLVALVRSLSVARKRNADLYEKMIKDASSYEAQVAVEKNLAEFIASNDNDFLKKANNRMIHMGGKDYKLNTTSAIFIEHKMDIAQSILNIFANPSLAYLLFLIGAALLYFEFQAPGGFVAGALGVLSLIMAGIAFQVLPLNVGALGLIILAFALFVVEIYVTSYGLLSLAGVLSLVIGSLFLFRTDEGVATIPNTLIFSTAGSILVFMIFLGTYLFKDWKKNLIDQPNDLVGLTGIAIVKNDKTKIKIKGEIWNAESSEVITDGEQIKILSMNDTNMTCTVTKA